MALLLAHWYRSVPLEIPTSNHHKSDADSGYRNAGTVGEVDFDRFTIFLTEPGQIPTGRNDLAVPTT
jgi:hypothetical protein